MTSTMNMKARDATRKAWWDMSTLRTRSSQMLGPPARMKILKTGTSKRGGIAWKEVMCPLECFKCDTFLVNGPQFSGITSVFSFVICLFNFQQEDHPAEHPATPYLDPTHILTADSHFCTMGSHILAAPQLMGMPSLGVWPMMLGDIVMHPAQKVWNLSVYFSGYP